MATSQSSLSFVPRRVKATASTVRPPSAPDHHRAVLSSAGGTTSYPIDVLLRVSLRMDQGAGKPRYSARRMQARSRMTLEKLMSHSVDYVHVEDVARALVTNAQDDALLVKDEWRIVVRTPSSSCAQALLDALLRRKYKAELLGFEEQEEHWRRVPEAIKNRARGRSERGAYALRKSRAAASQQRSETR